MSQERMRINKTFEFTRPETLPDEVILAAKAFGESVHSRFGIDLEAFARNLSIGFTIVSGELEIDDFYQVAQEVGNEKVKFSYSKEQREILISSEYLN